MNHVFFQSISNQKSKILALRRSLDQEVFIQALAKDFNMSVAYAAWRAAGSLVQSN